MGSIELDVPEHFKQHGISRIFQTGPYVKAIYKDVAITANFDVTKLKTFGKNFREEAGKIITSNGADAPELIEKLVTHIVAQVTTHYEKTGGGASNTASVGDVNSSGSDDQRQVAVMKYTLKRQEDGLPQLFETVKVAGKYHFVSYDPVQKKLVWPHDISEENRTLVPFTEEGIEPFSFQGADELERFIQLAKLENAGSLFRKAKKWAKKFHDTDVEEYINLIAGDVVFTFFQDRIGKTHYIFVWGEPDQGKGSILETFNQLGYRAASMTSATAATVYRMLGSVEKGQVIMIIDEANKIENDDFLQNVLKVGYKGKTKVPRVMDAQSSENNKIEYFYAYCFKIIAAERLPDQWKTGGFLSRFFKIKTAPGDPKIDIGDVVDNAGDTENTATLAELDQLRKLLFAYRLLHYHEPIPDVKIKGFTGRDRELTKPLIRLFRTHGDSASLETIKNTMHFFIKERNADKSDSFAAAILKYLNVLLLPNTDGAGQGQLTYKEIRQYVKDQLSGEDVDDKPGTFKTELFGEIGTGRLTGTIRSLGGKSARDATGDKRVWKFDNKTLARFERVYKPIPDTIELDEQATLELSDEEEQEEENNE